MKTTTRHLTLGLVLGAVACRASAPAEPPPAAAGGSPSTSALTLQPPSVSAPLSTSSSTLALRGWAPGASMVVVELQPGKNAVANVAPDGSFCADVTLQIGKDNLLSAVSLGMGQSSLAKRVTVRHDGAAAAAQETSCSPVRPPGKTDCSAAAAACDPTCNGCKEDFFQPNFSPATAPIISWNKAHAQAQLCPCHDDWFAITVAQGAPITAFTLYTPTPSFDLDIALYQATDVLPKPTSNPPVATSYQGVANGSTYRGVYFVAPAGGTYYLQVHALFGSGSYVIQTQ